MKWKKGASARINVVIPTRNRLDVLRGSLATAINQNDDNLVIHVSDNSDGPEGQDVVSQFNDPRIRYYKTPARLSMADNCEFSLSKVEHGWIALIGDDDGFMPDSLRRQIELLDSERMLGLTTRPCHYNWPSNNSAGQSILSIPKPSSQFYRVDCKQAIADAINYRHRTFFMPQTYTGSIVNFEVVDYIRSKLGKFFQCQIPDYYSGFAFSSVLDEILYSNDVFAIAGHSKHSIGRSLFKQEDNDFLRDGIIPFEARIAAPEDGTLTYSMPAILFECYFKTLHLHGDFLRVSNQQVLETILRETDFGRDRINDWGRRFAARHNLDYEVIAKRAAHKSAPRIFDQNFEKLKNFWNRYRIGVDSDLPIDDVYQASIVADAVVKLRPSWRVNNIATLRRLVRARIAL